MKPAQLPIPARDVKAGDAVTLERERIRQRATDELYYSMVLAPGSGGEGPAIDITTEFHSFILPAAALTPIHSTRPLRALWARTRVRVTAWVWTGGGVPGTFTLRLNAAQTGDGFAVGAPAYSVFNQDFTVTPLTGKITKVMFNAAGTINSSPGELVKIYLARLNDGNGNALNLPCALIEFLEAA